MPTYVYETLATSPGEAERFEIKQAFDELPLASHPTTGQPVRRVISGGLAVIGAASSEAPDAGPGCGPGTCGCGRFN